MLIVSGAIAIILFVILTLIQNSLLDKEETMVAYVSNIDVQRDILINKNMYNKVSIPISLGINANIVTSEDELIEKYAKEQINKGQIIFKQDIAEKEELKIIEASEGLERIAVKVKAAENAIAYQIKPKDIVNLYFTGKGMNIQKAFSKYGINFDSNLEENSLQTQKVISDIEVLGIYDENGRNYGNSEFSKLDTIVIAVTPEKAEMINNLRTQGTFDITR